MEQPLPSSMRGGRTQYNQALLSVYWLEARLWTLLELPEGSQCGVLSIASTIC